MAFSAFTGLTISAAHISKDQTSNAIIWNNDTKKIVAFILHQK